MSSCGRFTCVLAALVLVAVARPLPAGEACVPFKMTGITLVTEGPYPVPGEPNQFMLLLAGDGNATHLGYVTSIATVVFTFVVVPPGIPVPVAFEGDLTLVAANGDELWLTTYGEPTPEGGAGTFTIDGGTGRFEGATGEGDFEKIGDAGLFDGDICFIPGQRGKGPK